MIKIFILSALLAAPSYAQVRIAAPSAGASAWFGPMTGFVREAGMDRIAALESLSLSRLAAPGTDGRFAFAAAPQLLEPLVESLAEAGVDPVQFPDLPLEFQLTILQTAATLTEERLNMKVWRVVQDTHKGIGRSAFSEVAREAAKSREMSLYLNDRTMEGLAILEERVKKFHAAREEAERAFLYDLPGKIAAGEINAQTLLRTEDDGGRTLWKTEGESPERVYPTPEAALDARLETLTLMPPGPWSATEASLLNDALYRAMESGAISPSRWTVRAWNTLHEAQKAGLDAASESRLSRSASRLAAGRATTADVVAVEKFYVESYDRAGRVWPVQAKILAAIQTGGFGLPSWKDLHDARRALGDKLTRREIRGILFGISLGALASVIPSDGWSIALFLLVVVPFAAAVRSMLRRHAMDEYGYGSRLVKAMPEYFSRKS